MRHRPLEILLVEDDAELAEMVEQYLNESLRANVTRAESAGDALREELTARHHLLLASTLLPDGDGLELIRRVRENNDCPAMLMAESPTIGEVVAAVRLGVADVLTKPFDLEYLSTAVRKAVADHRGRRRERRRHQRLRQLVARVVCERRDLAKRIDLLCRDFVHAHRRLAEKVTAAGILVDQTLKSG